MSDTENPHEQIESGLEIPPLIRHHQITWKIKRFLWGVMAIIAAAAFASLFGDGSLAKASLADPSGYASLEYDRFGRRQCPAQWRLRVNRESSLEIRVTIDQKSVASVDLVRIEPEPARVETSPNQLVYTFNRSDIEGSVEIVFHFQPLEAGKLNPVMDVNGKALLAFTSWIYP